MIPPEHSNLASWFAQVFVMGSFGALLPLLFRIRHPGTQLAYNHLVLAVCLVLPLIQPWRPSTVSWNAGSADAAYGIVLPWERVGFGILAAGFFLRLAWLAAGMFQIRRYRKASITLDPIPDSVSVACDRVPACAEFRVSQEVRSPATVGFLRPVVLLPESFLALNAAWQHGIACHELLHVRRRDWLVTVIEEVVAAVFWFPSGRVVAS